MKEFLKTWWSSILMVFLGWIIVNSFVVGLEILLYGSFNEEANFFKAFLSISVFELIIISCIAVIIFSFIWLFKPIIKGVRKEKNENKHRRDNR